MHSGLIAFLTGIGIGAGATLLLAILLLCKSYLKNKLHNSNTSRYMWLSSTWRNNA
jgi:hypothetical protein